MAERAADFRLAPGSEPDRQDRLPPLVLVGLVVKEALFSKMPLATHSRLGKIGSMKARKPLVPRPPIYPGQSAWPEMPQGAWPEMPHSASWPGRCGPAPRADRARPIPGSTLY